MASFKALAPHRKPILLFRHQQNILLSTTFSLYFVGWKGESMEWKILQPVYLVTFHFISFIVLRNQYICHFKYQIILHDKQAGLQLEKTFIIYSVTCFFFFQICVCLLIMHIFRAYHLTWAGKMLFLLNEDGENQIEDW